MSFFEKKKVPPKKPPSALDSIDEIIGITDTISKIDNSVQATTQSLADMTRSNELLKKELKEKARKMNLNLDDEDSPNINKHSTGNSFVENHKEETGFDFNKSDNPDNQFGSTENTQEDNQKKDNAGKRSEVPLLSRTTVVGIGNRLKESVFGQDKVVDVIENRLVINTVGLQLNEDKPAGCFLFAGPSGVGKTELCVQLSKQLDVPILVVNMGEHGLEQDVTKLIGVASGYVGYANGGLLTNFVLENPRCIIVFDELEKAHTSINKILLSILDKGVCRDNKNREVFFDQTLFVATTNLGASIEYETHLTEDEKFRYRMEIIKDKFAPEIINRYDNIFQFQPLTHETYGSIVRKFMKQLSDIAKKRNKFEINSTDALIEFATKHSYDPAMGGRPARRFIEMIILQPLAFKLLDQDVFDKIIANGELLVDYQDEKIIFKLNDAVIASLDNTNDLVADYNKDKFTAPVEEEIAESDLPESEIPPALQLESVKEKDIKNPKSSSRANRRKNDDEASSSPPPQTS